MGFAGGFTLGMVQAGFTLVGKREMPGGFGVPNCEANRHLLGHDWKSEVGEPETWSAPDADVVFGNPPCSGFSVMSAKHWRGADSPANHCMWAFTNFVAKAMPQIAVFESVQMARTREDGLQLMRALRENVERQTNKRWDLYHVRHNALSLGGCAQRRRYFFVISRVPFGVEIPKVKKIPSLLDAIGDLAPLGQTWERQSYRAPATWWSSTRRSMDHTVDGHITVDNPLTRRIGDLLAQEAWHEGESIGTVLKRYHETHGKFPPSFAWTEEKVVRNNFNMGFTTPTRWSAKNPARVITGGSLHTGIHPVLDRTLTHREAARVMGFPDNWNLYPLRKQVGLSATHGKGITVDCGRWIGSWINSALSGDPGSHTGQELTDREWDIDVTNTFKTLA